MAVEKQKEVLIRLLWLSTKMEQMVGNGAADPRLDPLNGPQSRQNGPPDEAKSQNGPHGAKLSPRGRFRCQKGSPGHEKTVHFRAQNGRKIDGNTCQNMDGFRTRFHDAFLPHFRSKRCQNRALEARKWKPKRDRIGKTPFQL